jgi:hypothetical protein
MAAVSPGYELLQVWHFVRGDMSPKEFELWICSNPQMEPQLGAAFYFDLIAADYHDLDVVHDFKRRLSLWALGVEPLHCLCITLADLALVNMGDHHVAVFATLEMKASRGQPFWWLSVYGCSACGEWWLVAQEERQNDIFCMRRLHDQEIASITSGQEWQQDFDRYEDLLRIAWQAGVRFQFVDPMASSSLRWTIEDLAKARPGIHISELATLLNLGLETASRLAHRVVEATGVTIEFDYGDPRVEL